MHESVLMCVDVCICVCVCECVYVRACASVGQRLKLGVLYCPPFYVLREGLLLKVELLDLGKTSQGATPGILLCSLLRVRFSRTWYYS